MPLSKGWEVEWCAGCPIVDGETMMDDADMRCRDFADKERALKFAAIKLKEDFFGSVRVVEFELQPYEPGYPGLTKEYISEPEYID